MGTWFSRASEIEELRAENLRQIGRASCSVRRRGRHGPGRVLAHSRGGGFHRAFFCRRSAFPSHGLGPGSESRRTPDDRGAQAGERGQVLQGPHRRRP